MEILKNEKFMSLDSIVRAIDSFRAAILRATLKIHFIRRLYSQTHYRLAAGMLFSAMFYLPIAFRWPELLLAFGPFIFGYPHLLASYRFTARPQMFRLFMIATFIAIVLHLTNAGFLSFDQLPFGVWQIVVASGTFLVAEYLSKSMTLKNVSLASLICITCISLAWTEPVMYVGGVLILHNWVSFIYWIKSANSKPEKKTAWLSTLLFLMIHILVYAGFLDSWIPMKEGVIAFDGATQNTGWYLASWTSESITWYRLLVLYTFGLSIHYFVWLKAIPETHSKFAHPNSFRMIAQNLKNDLGAKTLVLTIVISVIGMLIWSLSFSLGNRIYFELAILHGSLELIYVSTNIHPPCIPAPRS